MDVSSIVALVLSGAALLFSVLGPYITAKAQIKHEEKMYKKRFYEEHKHETIEKYIQAAGQTLFFIGADQLISKSANFTASCSEIFMYLPEHLWGDAEKMNSAIMAYLDDDNNALLRDAAKSLYFDFCKKIKELGRE